MTEEMKVAESSAVSPERLILRLYDIGIESCLASNKDKVKRVLNELIAALDFEYRELSSSFYDLYQFALRLVDNDKLNEVLPIFQGLRSSWEKLVAAREGED
jgi:flagellar protein FliS